MSTFTFIVIPVHERINAGAVTETRIYLHYFIADNSNFCWIPVYTGMTNVFEEDGK